MVDVLVIGGGIVGLSTAMHIGARFPTLALAVVEKELALASHQTGHNSGVVHAGVYYPPGSLKARFCREGADATFSFCQERGLPVERCGKLIVATNQAEVERLDALYGRCVQNGLQPERLSAAELTRCEPRIVGRSAIRITSTGIADYPAIARAMGDAVRARGGEIVLDAQVTAIREFPAEVIVESTAGLLRASHLVVCGGLMADRLARMCGLDLDFAIVPFRGEYYRLPPSMDGIVAHLIYPVPDPTHPILGIHLTRMIGGYVTVGPNAVLALAREGYEKGAVRAEDLRDLARFPGFWRLAYAHRRSGLAELRNSLFRSGYLAACRRYCPELNLDDLLPHPAGIRAQAVRPDGTMVHDFLIHRTRRTVHVCNAPSPAATAAIPIGGYLASQFADAAGLESHEQAERTG